MIKFIINIFGTVYICIYIYKYIPLSIRVYYLVGKHLSLFQEERNKSSVLGESQFDKYVIVLFLLLVIMRTKPSPNENFASIDFTDLKESSK